MGRTIEDFVDLYLAIVVIARYYTDVRKENCINVVKEMPNFDGMYVIYERSITVRSNLAFSASMLLSISR